MGLVAEVAGQRGEIAERGTDFAGLELGWKLVEPERELAGDRVRDRHRLSLDDGDVDGAAVPVVGDAASWVVAASDAA